MWLKMKKNRTKNPPPILFDNWQRLTPLQRKTLLAQAYLYVYAFTLKRKSAALLLRLLAEPRNVKAHWV